MPSKEDIAKIQVAFATQYGLDLAGIHKDTETLRTLVAEIPINSNQINNSCYTFCPHEWNFLPFESVP
jgi:hypothetical protein